MGGQESSQRRDPSKTSENNTVTSQKLNHFFSVVSSDGGDTVTRTNFINYFPEAGRSFAEKLFMQISSSESESTKAKCSECLMQVFSVATTTAQNSFYIVVFSGIILHHQDITSLLQAALTLFLLHSGVSPQRSNADDSAIQSLAGALTTMKTAVSAAEWMDVNCPELFNVLHRCVVGWLQGAETPGRPHLEDAFTDQLLCRAQWWILQSSLSAVFTRGSRPTPSPAGNEEESDSLWDLLYSSQDHGLSTNRLQHHVFGYRGPTVLLLSCDDGTVYAVAVDTEWREGTQSWGGHGCCIIRLSPDVKRLEEGDNMILFNDRSRNIPRGISVGRNSKKRLLRFKDGLEMVEHDHKTSSVRTLEIWGCGGAGMRTAQAKQKKTELKDAERAAKVKLPGQWEDNPDRTLLEMAGVTVNHAEQFARD